MNGKVIVLASLLLLAVLCQGYGRNQILSDNEAFSSQSYQGSAWQQQSGKQKLESLWRAVTQSTKPNKWLSTLGTAQIFFYDMKKTMNTVGDELPIIDITGNTRDKTVHTVGAVAKAKFVSNGKHSYTGVFKGAENVLARFSLAKAPSVEEGIVPGMAVKFLIDGKPSVNMFSMYSLFGHKSFNPFEKDFTTNVADVPSDAGFVIKKLRDTFAKASQYPTMLALSHLSKIKPNGDSETSPNFPFQLTLKPTVNVRRMFADARPGADWLAMLEAVSPQILYTVYAKASPKAAEVEIGYLQLTTRFTGSDFGDKKLFFQHQPKERDFEIHPEWIAQL